METIDIDAPSEDELDYEDENDSSNIASLQKSNVNTAGKIVEKFSDTSENENDDESGDDDAGDASRRVDLSRRVSTKRRHITPRTYVDLDDAVRHSPSSRRSIHERIKITALRRSGGADASTIDSNDYVDSRDLNELFRSLDVDPDDPGLRKNSIFVKGVDKLSEFEVKRIFAEFSPESVQFVDETACTVRWSNDVGAAKMMLGMTKTMRRVRGPRKPEEGELLDSDEEEVGQIREENGDDVAVVGDVSEISSQKRKRTKKTLADDCVEINVEEVKLPSGKWRVVTRHVPDNRLIIVRFATGFDIRRGVINARNRMARATAEIDRKSAADSRSSARDDYEYSWKAGEMRVRPGLNIFDDKGNELEWDYEHDTRFYENPNTTASTTNEEEEGTSSTESDAEREDAYKRRRRAKSGNNNGDNDECVKLDARPTTQIVGNVAIRSRGRGSKKFLAAIAGSDGDSGEDGAAASNETASGSAGLSSTLASDVVSAGRPLRSFKSTKKLNDSPEHWTKKRLDSDSSESHHQAAGKDADDDEEELVDYEDLCLDEDR